MSTHSAITPDDELENKHRALWALGDYATVATDLVAPLGPILVEAAAVKTGDRVLDVAAGAGNVAIPAALAGADVIATDLCPPLLDTGRKLADACGANLRWQEANAEALPFADDAFDTVLSCVGVMFAPHHQRAADELVRVCHRGGTIGLINWTPEGFIGQMLTTMKPYLPVPPARVGSPPMWGSEDYLRNLLGNTVVEFTAQRRALRVDSFVDGAAFRDYFKTHYGPTISAYRGIASEPARVAALDTELAALGDRYLGGSSAMEWEYLLVTARKAPE